jgi:hypothetical protein
LETAKAKAPVMAKERGLVVKPDFERRLLATGRKQPAERV